MTEVGKIPDDEFRTQKLKESSIPTFNHRTMDGKKFRIPTLPMIRGSILRTSLNRMGHGGHNLKTSPKF
jgi:hypothetical protein